MQKIFPLLLIPVCQLCSTSLRGEISVQWKQEQPPAMALWSAITQNSIRWPQLHGQVHDLFHDFARITFVWMGSTNFFLWTRPLIEFRGSSFWNKKSFSEQFAYTSWLWVPAKACSEPLKGGSLPQTSHQHWLSASGGSKGSVLQPSWVLAQGGLIRAGLCCCLLWYGFSQEDTEGSKNMIFSYYEHQSASCSHIFLFQMD